ncbi:MAG: hypothetical protein NTY45_10045 [Elusimicrobia bacterium]|nr:hypothetical protein [Elusimicrobiota bacterium]
MKTGKAFKFFALALACAFSFHAPAAAVQTAPSLISFQGRLTDNMNNPLAGSYDFAFAIYDAPTGGSLLWSETQNGIIVFNGVLTAELGASLAITDSVFSSSYTYLAITVSTNGVVTPLLPRQRLLSVPYAMNAQRINGMDFSALVTTGTAQSISGPKTFTANINMSGTRITDLAVPISTGDAANKAYVDSVIGSSQSSVLSATQTFTGQNTFLNQVSISSDIYITGQINLLGNLVTTPAGLLDATKLAGIVPNYVLDSSSVTKRGNTFNGPDQLVLLDVFGKLPALDGSALMNISTAQFNAVMVDTTTIANNLAAVTLSTGAIADSVTAEAVIRSNADSALTGQVSAVILSTGAIADSVTAETVIRSNADSALTGQVSAVILSTGAIADSVTAEAIVRSNADSALTGQVSAVVLSTGAIADSVTAEAVIRSNADSALTGQLNAVAVSTGILGVGVIVSSVGANGVRPGSILAGAIMNADINAAAAIAISKLATSGTLGANVIVSSIAVNAVYPASVQSGTYGIGVTGNAGTVTNGLYSNGSYADPTWLTSVAGTKVSGDISGNAANINGNLAASKVAAGALGAGVIASSIAVNAVQDASIVGVSGTKVGSGVPAANIASGSLGANVIASSIAVGGVYTGALLDSAVTSAKIADGTIIAADIAVSTISLDKLNQSGCTSNQIPKWNGSAWACAADVDTNTTYTADETSLHLAGTTFSALSSSVTLQGNSFNTAGKLVQLDGSGYLPALNGSALTNLTPANVANGTLGVGVIVSSVGANGVRPGSILAGAIMNADINANAAIAFTKLAALPSANILVGNASNIATAVAMSGDGIISNAGALTIIGFAKLASTQTFTGVNTFASTTAFTAQNASLPGVTISSGLIVSNGKVGIGTASPQHTLDVSGSMYSRRYSLTDAATIAVDWDNGNTQSVTIGASRTVTFADGRDGGKYILIIKQGGTGSYTITWPATVRWPNGLAATLTTTVGKTDWIGFIYNGVDSKYDAVAFTSNL